MIPKLISESRGARMRKLTKKYNRLDKAVLVTYGVCMIALIFIAGGIGADKAEPISHTSNPLQIIVPFIVMLLSALTGIAMDRYKNIVKYQIRKMQRNLSHQNKTVA